jgi:hypothetical protein
MELALVERIAVTMWRQRRLVRAETAGLKLSRQPVPTAKAVSAELARGYGNEIKPDNLQPFDAERETFCRAVIAEAEALEEIDLRSLESRAPTIYGQLITDSDGEAPETFLAGHKGGLTGYVGELMLWSRAELREAGTRPHILSIAEQVRARGAILQGPTLELLARYQTTLDNQLYKALRALREAQEWRLKTLEVALTETADRDNSDAA